MTSNHQAAGTATDKVTVDRHHLTELIRAARDTIPAAKAVLDAHNSFQATTQEQAEASIRIAETCLRLTDHGVALGIELRSIDPTWGV